MFEKVNPAHPDKLADRIAGAIVDAAYKLERNPKVAAEVLLGHGKCLIINETSVHIRDYEDIVHRIAGDVEVEVIEVQQDPYLAANQASEIKCGDNGIFRGAPVTAEQKELANIALQLYARYGSDGKYLLHNNKLTVCQSNATNEELQAFFTSSPYEVVLNPLGEWSGGTDVDSGATNRKLGSDMGDAMTGGGLHGKDLSKADVTLNIYAHIQAQETGETVELSCSIGDSMVDGKPYAELVEIARAYIASRGGFENFAAWGLV